MIQFNGKKNILYIISGETGFKQNDEAILSDLGRVQKINIVSLAGILNFKNFRLMKWCDSIVIWFASFHAIPFILLNKLFNKNLFIIAGGYDVANCPSINYGAMRFGYRRSIGQWMLSQCDNVISVSNSNKNEILQNSLVAPNRIKLIYNAIELKNQQEKGEKTPQVLTVGEINEETILRKGLDRFIHVAKSFPDVQFIHIGKWTDKHGNSSKKAVNYLKNIAPKNVQFLGFVKKDVLENYFMDSKIYLQLSRHEAFGVSVVEAMNYGCIPIVANVFALPEVVGDNGFIVKTKSECVSAIKTVFSNNYSQEIKINPLFDLSERKGAFERLLAH